LGKTAFENTWRSQVGQRGVHKGRSERKAKVSGGEKKRTRDHLPKLEQKYARNQLRQPREERGIDTGGGWHEKSVGQREAVGEGGVFGGEWGGGIVCKPRKKGFWKNTKEEEGEGEGQFFLGKRAEKKKMCGAFAGGEGDGPIGDGEKGRVAGPKIEGTGGAKNSKISLGATPSGKRP